MIYQRTINTKRRRRESAVHSSLGFYSARVGRVPSWRRHTKLGFQWFSNIEPNCLICYLEPLCTLLPRTRGQRVCNFDRRRVRFLRTSEPPTKNPVIHFEANFGRWQSKKVSEENMCNPLGGSGGETLSSIRFNPIRPDVDYFTERR